VNERDKAALKDSGIQWVGLIPKEWDVIRLKNSVEGCFNGIWGDDPDEGLFDTPCIRVADFDRTKNSVSLKKLTMRKIELASSNPRFLKRGDLLIEKSGGGEQSPVGNVVIFNHTFKAVCSNFVGRLPVRSQHSSHYWNFVHQSIYAIRLNTCSIKQNTGIQNLDTTQYLDERVPTPPLSEQRQIAAYLNRETAKLDELIAKQQKLIKLLQEKRQTVISQTVTKGLDPNAKMKDSGVEWLGEVPQHWNLLRGKSLFKIKKRIAGKLGLEILSITQKGIKVKDTESGGGQLSMDYSKYQLVFPGDFAMNHMDLLTGYVDISKYHGVTSPDYRVFEMKGDQDAFFSKFYKFVLQNCYHEKLFFPFGQGSSQLGRWRLPTEAFNEFVYPVPPIDEQRAIANLIEVEISRSETLTNKANTCISLLKEHRQALITAAVTGKIDVRGLVSDEEVAALDADPVLETTEEDFESEVAEAEYITEEE
jgi:type I restriction enzyme S subunit